MRDGYRRWGWLGVLIVGLILYLVVLRTLVRTQNPNFVPALILLGATVVPLAFLAFAQARAGRWQVPAATLVVSAFFGGVIGTVVAGTLEYDTLRGLGTLPTFFVALIEESAKLVVPLTLLFLVTVRHGRRLPSDGLIIGVAAGMGFAALETMGYAFSALLSSQGNIGAVEQTLFIRGLTAPAGHTAWTGLTAGAIWALLASPSGKRVWEAIVTLVGVIVLHTLWDTFTGVVPFIILAIISLGWLFWAMRRYKAFGERSLQREAVPV